VGVEVTSVEEVEAGAPAAAGSPAVALGGVGARREGEPFFLTPLLGLSLYIVSNTIIATSHDALILAYLKNTMMGSYS
jgi:hypothetical protein